MTTNGHAEDECPKDDAEGDYAQAPKAPAAISHSDSNISVAHFCLLN